MATINVSDLHSTGAELFSDSESYMNELSNGEIDLITGASIGGILVKLGKYAYTVAARNAPKLLDNYDPSKISMLCNLF